MTDARGTFGARRFFLFDLVELRITKESRGPQGFGAHTQTCHAEHPDRPVSIRFWLHGAGERVTLRDVSSVWETRRSGRLAEPRDSFVSLLSDAGVLLEDISRLVGHSGTSVTDLVYRHQIRPVIQTGATVMDQLFGQRSSGA